MTPPPFLFSSSGTQSKHHTNTASMLLPASGGDTESTSTFCSCYAPVTVLNSKNSESKGATVFMKDHANGQGAPPEANRPPPPPPPLPPPLKSNLKKPITVGEPQQHQQQVMVRDGRRKVSWPDAHGRDLAHVQVFHSSVLEEGEFAMTGKSCVCSIQ
ncbi:hypothetical protein Cni_G07471 [Canna indica]|uniref:Uncharacterized protein n=1 Tax=Canna indica TaxID=4628 RepID=A0AAQ3K0F0_9LILI|nr:hypothetical protein Cni_G07471 [Canna indica]